jgi:hypothetical protein
MAPMTDGPEKIEDDPAAVVEALRRLLEVGFAEDTDLINRSGGWPDDVRDSPATAAIKHPIAFACRQAVTAVRAHLATLIGAEAAAAQFDALIAEQNARPDVKASLEIVEQSSGKAPPHVPSLH